MRRAAKRIRREQHHEIDAEAFPLDGTQVRDRRLDSAAEHIHRNLVADFQAKAVGSALLEGNQRRAAVIFRPPFARDQRRAFGEVSREGDAAVGLQHPRLVRRRPSPDRRARLSRRKILPRSIGTSASSPVPPRCLMKALKRSTSFEGISTKKKLGALCGQRLRQLPPQIAVDQRERDQQRQVRGPATARRTASAHPADERSRAQAAARSSAGAASVSATAISPSASSRRIRKSPPPRRCR